MIAEELQGQILEALDLTKEVEDEQLIELIHDAIERRSAKEYISLRDKTSMGKELFNAFRKLDILQELVEDDSITEIMINGTEGIFIERDGAMRKLEKRFISRRKLEDVIQQIVAGANRIVNEATPIVDARLQDGSRVNVVLPPVALNGPIVTIRKFSKKRISMEELVKRGSLSREMTELLGILTRAKYNIFISGGTGSG